MTAIEALDVVINDENKLYTNATKAEARERLRILQHEMIIANAEIAFRRAVTIEQVKP